MQLSSTEALGWSRKLAMIVAKQVGAQHGRDVSYSGEHEVLGARQRLGGFGGVAGWRQVAGGYVYPKRFGMALECPFRVLVPKVEHGT